MRFPSWPKEIRVAQDPVRMTQSGQESSVSPWRYCQERGARREVPANSAGQGAGKAPGAGVELLASR